MVQMRAVVYEGPFKVSIGKVNKPTILHPNDVIVKGTCFPSGTVTGLMQYPFYSHDVVHLRKVEYLLGHILGSCFSDADGLQRSAHV